VTHIRTIEVPRCWSTTVKVDRNRARQLLVAGQRSDLAGGNDAPVVKLSDGRTVRLVGSARGLADGELALKVSKEVLDGDPATAESPKPSWLGARNATSPADVLESLHGRFAFLEGSDDGTTPGLRVPQLGAVHAVLGFWTTGTPEPATVMMPTGTGKTETMVALLAAVRPMRLLVIVPSDALRRQIAEKFETYGLLQTSGVIGAEALRPVVGQVHHGFLDAPSAEAFAAACNVIVTTPKALGASPDAARDAVLNSSSHLFVDEAHHVEATTWRQIRDAFAGRPVVQFTATPYREDGRRLIGRRIYAFPLAEAQRRGYFSEIDYTSVIDFSDPDGALADHAVARLRADLDAGLDHVLMARVNRIGRAHELRGLYEQIAADLAPVVLDSSLTKRDRDAGLTKLLGRDSRIVVCVDMLGEGFDLPSLKIAAIHDPHKSLGVTLQYVGRFARVAGAVIGRASVFVARPDRDYDHRLRRLYAEDADWNAIISDLSASATEEEHGIDEFEAGFQASPEDVPMRSLAPKMSTVVYRTRCADWNPDGVTRVHPEDTLLTWPVPLNLDRRVLWFIAELREEITWAELPSVEEVAHHLYVAYWDDVGARLYINSTNKASHHEQLAKALAGDDVEIVKGLPVYRAMHNIQRMVPTNVGLLDIRNRNRRFTMLVGANVREGFPTAEAQTKTQTNIFASGFEEGRRVTIGASQKGRVWSYRQAKSIKHWVDWCDHIGAKVTDPTIDIDEVMGSFIRPEELTARPDLVAIGIEWPSEFWLTISEDTVVALGDVEHPLLDAELRIIDFTTNGPFRFELRTPDWRVPYEGDIVSAELRFRALGTDAELRRPRAGSIAVAAYLQTSSPMILLEQEGMIIAPALLIRPDTSSAPFDTAKLDAVSWTGVNIRKESQGRTRDADSIQARAMEQVLAMADWDVVLDDDGTGEVADIVALRIDGRDLHVLLVHCKYSSQDDPGARVGDLYDVCGQTQKSIRWKQYPEDMLARLIRREQRRRKHSTYSGFHVGDGKALYDVLDRARTLRHHFSVIIAQPGLAKASVSRAQLDLLASTEVYLSDVAVADLRVWCSA
jgi:superfamily II DNA or RNA helicase